MFTCINRPVAPRALRSPRFSGEEAIVNGRELIGEIKRKFALKTDKAVARRLGMTQLALLKWKRRKSLTVRQIANAIDKSSKNALESAHGAMIRPIVEYFPLDAVESRGGVRYELFPAGKGDNPLHVQLRQILKGANGIYIFYDSRGRAIYAGKAKSQSLWGELKSVFNRDRDTQTVYRVRHPSRRQTFVPGYAKSRQPRRTPIRLSDLAAYVTAYEVDPAVIDNLEALLVRSFANDLLNVRMERFMGLRTGAKRRSRGRGQRRPRGAWRR